MSAPPQVTPNRFEAYVAQAEIAVNDLITSVRGLPACVVSRVRTLTDLNALSCSGLFNRRPLSESHVFEPFGRHNPNASTYMVNKALRLTKSTPITSPLLPLLTPAQALSRCRTKNARGLRLVYFQ